LTARTFFSEKDTRTPAILGTGTIILYYILAVNLSSPERFGLFGLPMSNSLVAWIFLVISIAILNNRHKNDASLVSAIGFTSPVQMLLAAIIEAAALYGYSSLIGEIHGTLPLIGFLAGGAVIGAAVYLGLLMLFGNQDLSATLKRLLRREN
jgi:peptidoglycan biosynthesis protein MviN/MurJ (putative lipid II flippase)